MSSRSTWRGLNEIVGAKERARLILLEIERLHKQQRTLQRGDIKNQIESLLADLDETIDLVREQGRELVKDLELHRRKLIAKNRFLERHYGMKK